MNNSNDPVSMRLRGKSPAKALIFFCVPPLDIASFPSHSSIVVEVEALLRRIRNLQPVCYVTPFFAHFKELAISLQHVTTYTSHILEIFFRHWKRQIGNTADKVVHCSPRIFGQGRAAGKCTLKKLFCSGLIKAV